MAKEKTVELKPKVEKISEEHLTELQKIVNQINNYQFNIGKLESQKHNMLHALSIAQDKIGSMQAILTKEYGTCDVNVTDGSINWSEDEK